MKQALYILFFFLLSLPGFGQNEKKYIREGNDLFNHDKFNESELSYRKALDIKPNYRANFNLGNALYKQEKFEEAGKEFVNMASNKVNPVDKAKAYHNLGNAKLKEGKIDKAIEAYKESLRNNPDDQETKYNLAYAKHLLQQQQQQQQQEKNQKDNKNQDQQENKDQKEQEQNQQNKEEKKEEQKKQENNENQQKPQDQQDEKKEKQAGQKISKEDAQRLLEALARDEKKVQDKVKKQKAKSKKVRVIKDW